jgi:serine/threonine protein kinase
MTTAAISTSSIGIHQFGHHRKTVPSMQDECEDSSSNISDSIRHRSRQIEKADLSIEAVLASGGFTTICRVQFDGEDKTQQEADDSDSDASFATDESYAMKCLSLSKIPTPAAFKTAARNIYYEASILSRLDHPNIITLEGISSSYFKNGFSPADDDDECFILLELLQGTLRNRLDLWRNQQSRFFKGSSHSGAPGGDRRSLSHWSGRLKVASEIASGMKYLHSQGIVFENLEPENVGFDLKNGSVKLFDFGMARPLEESFAESAMTGSFRYTAPEKILCQPSGYPSDVYSFGVLLWELSTLQLPFQAFFFTDKTTKQQVFAQTKFTSHVILKSWRPETDDIDCPQTKELIEKCWSAKPELRPSFEAILDTVTRTYRHHEQRNVKESRDSTSFRGGLLRARSFNSPRRSNSFDRRVSSKQELLKRTFSGGKVSRLKPVRTRSYDQTRSSASASMSATIDSPNSAQASGTSPPLQRKRRDSLGRRILRKVPSAGKIIKCLSSSSHHTASTSCSLDDVGLDNVSLSRSPDESESSPGNVLSPAANYMRKEEDSERILSAACKEMLSISSMPLTRPIRSAAMPTINSQSSEQSSSSFNLDDPVPAGPPVALPQTRKQNLGHRLIRRLSTSSRTGTTEPVEENDFDPSDYPCGDHVDGAMMIPAVNDETIQNIEGQPTKPPKSMLQRSSSATGTRKLLRNLSGSLMGKKRLSSWSSSSPTSLDASIDVTTANEVWDYHSGTTSSQEDMPSRTKRAPRRHFKGARAEISSSSSHFD